MFRPPDCRKIECEILRFRVKEKMDDTDSCEYGAEGAFAFSIAEQAYVGTGVFDSQFWEFTPDVTSVKKIPKTKVKNTHS